MTVQEYLKELFKKHQNIDRHKEIHAAKSSKKFNNETFLSYKFLIKEFQGESR